MFGKKTLGTFWNRGMLGSMMWGYVFGIVGMLGKMMLGMSGNRGVLGRMMVGMFRNHEDACGDDGGDDLERGERLGG